MAAWWTYLLAAVCLLLVAAGATTQNVPGIGANSNISKFVNCRSPLSSFENPDTSHNLTFCRGYITYSTPLWLNLQTADAAAETSEANSADSECPAFKSKALHCWMSFPHCEEENNGAVHRLCQERCFSSARWAGCARTLPEVDSFCSQPGLERSDFCFDPLETTDLVPFGQLMREIIGGTVAMSSVWLLLACAPRLAACLSWLGAAMLTGRYRPIGREDEAPSGQVQHWAEAEGEAVPLTQLGAAPPQGSAAEAPDAEEGAQQPKHECRICKEEEDPSSGRLIEPCKCSGSMQRVHPECLQKWVETKATDQEYGELSLRCEVCLEEYDVVVQQRFACSLSKLCSHASWSEYSNCALLLCLLPLIFTAMWLSCKQTHQNGRALCKEDGHWTLVAIGVLLCMMFISTLVKITLRWWMLNQELRLVPNARM